MRAELLSLSPEKVITQMFFVVVSTTHTSQFSLQLLQASIYTRLISEEMIALDQYTYIHRKSIPFFYVVLLFSRQKKIDRKTKQTSND